MTLRRHAERRGIFFILGGAAIFLGSCAAPSTQIATGLIRYGLDAERADCVGHDLAGRLSIAQLRELGRAAHAYRSGDSDPSDLAPSDLVRVAAKIRDPAVPIAVAGAILRCGVFADVS